VTLVAKEKLGLRPLIFHVDAGWNSQQSVNNIEKLVDGLGLDLHTEVVDWLEMKDLQLAFFRAQVPHLDTPQDHVFFAALYNFAARNGFKYVLTGANYSTECVREPLEWHYHASDLRQLRDIHKRFGTRPLRTFPLADIFTYRLYYRFIKGIRVVKPLNYVPYSGTHDAGAGRPIRLAKVRPQALRIEVHAILRRVLRLHPVTTSGGRFLEPHSTKQMTREEAPARRATVR
jgi:tRNA(Ile)-lysidine synthase TilS/MesJ